MAGLPLCFLARRPLGCGRGCPQGGRPAPGDDSRRAPRDGAVDREAIAQGRNGMTDRKRIGEPGRRCPESRRTGIERVGPKGGPVSRVFWRVGPTKEFVNQIAAGGAGPAGPVSPLLYQRELGEPMEVGT